MPPNSATCTGLNDCKPKSDDPVRCCAWLGSVVMGLTNDAAYDALFAFRVSIKEVLSYSLKQLIPRVANSGDLIRLMLPKVHRSILSVEQ